MWIALFIAMTAGASDKLSFPSSHGELFSSIVMHVDHADGRLKSRQECVDYKGKITRTNCYPGHHGTDFLLIGGFKTMAKNIDVRASAGGTILKTVDGKIDTCHYMPRKLKVACPGTDKLEPNYVMIQQDDGLIAVYFHLKKNSIIVREGRRVECGTPLAYVGSSGYSSMPHIHFELRKMLKNEIALLGDDYASIKKRSDTIDPYELELWSGFRKDKTFENEIPLYGCPNKVD